MVTILMSLMDILAGWTSKIFRAIRAPVGHAQLVRFIDVFQSRVRNQYLGTWLYVQVVGRSREIKWLKT